MTAPVNWRIKGINRSTRQKASEAASRNGLSVGEWLERAIDDNAGVLPPEEDTPLVSTKLLDPARETVAETEFLELDTMDRRDQATDPIAEPATSDADSQPYPSLSSTNPKNRPRQVPKVSPTLIAALPRRTYGNLPRIVGGFLFVGLLAGTYWLVDQNTKNKLAAETDALAGRSAATSGVADSAVTENSDSDQEQIGQTTAPTQLAVLTPLQKLTASANNGNARAQYDLGLMYVDGEGVERNPKLGAQWLDKSAATGLPEAQYRLGLLYRKGLGVPSNMQSAFQWYEKAALQGHVRAQYDLGTLYTEGEGTEKDYEKAARWFTRASKAGLAEAHYSLGTIHENGLGVERDQRKAAAHYRSALAAGSSRAAAKLARLEPALKDLAITANRTLLEPDDTISGPGSQQIPAKDRALSATGIKKLQRLLIKLDLEPGPQDGLLGEKTIIAIKLYQKFAGLPIDGKPTLELLLDLRQVVDAMSAEHPAAAAPASGR